MYVRMHVHMYICVYVRMYVIDVTHVIDVRNIGRSDFHVQGQVHTYICTGLSAAGSRTSAYIPRQIMTAHVILCYVTVLLPW